MKLSSLAFALVLAATAGAEVPPRGRNVDVLIEDGTLRLKLDDAVRLALESDAARIDRLGYESAQAQVDSAASRFDPRMTSTFTALDSTARSTVETEGALRRIDTQQSGSVSLSQILPTGTQTSLTMAGGRQSTNNAFATVNPQFNSSLRFQITQPLWRNQAGFIDRANLRMAKQGEAQARADLTARLAASVQRAVDRYWTAVLAVEALSVRRKSLELAEATYNKNKRMLELGALAPLEIHQSEADVASRKLDVLRGELDLRRRHDELRRELGIDLDPKLAALPLVLVDAPEGGAAEAVDGDALLAQALRARPELQALERQLEARETRVRVAQSNTRVGLDLVGSYSLSGVGGTELDPTTDPPTIVLRSGLGSAFDQVRDRNFPVYSVSLVADLPIRNRRVKSDLAQARIEQERTRLDLQEHRQQIALEVRRAVDDVESTRQAIDLAATARDLSQKTLESEQRKYELGVTQLFFVLDAQARLAQSELALLSARVDQQQALTRLDLASGRLLDRYKISVD
jgi:outer membrane protein TolC